MSFLIFEKNGDRYFYETTLPLSWKRGDPLYIENHLKNMDSALTSLSMSKNATWDSVTMNTIIYHASALKRHTKFLYSDLKWNFIITFLERMGFNFVGLSEVPDGYPLEEVR